MVTLRKYVIVVILCVFLLDLFVQLATYISVRNKHAIDACMCSPRFGINSENKMQSGKRNQSEMLSAPASDTDQHYTTLTFRDEDAFLIGVTRQEKAVMKQLLVLFDNVTRANNLDYMLWDGSLLGSYRHHGPIPWDDDIDLIMNVSRKPEIEEAFSSLGQGAVLHTTSVRWKLFFNDSMRTRPGWNWPFLDIAFYTENSTHVWEYSSYTRYYFEKSKVFPITSRPFFDGQFLVPRDTFSVLSPQYDLNMCMTNTYSHKWETSQKFPPPIKLPCEELKDKFPFVERERSELGTYETLIIGGRNLSYVFLDDE